MSILNGMDPVMLIQLATSGSSLLPANGSALDSIPYALFGFFVVITVLALLMMVTVLIGLFFRFFSRAGSRVTKPESPATPTLAAVDKELVLVVAAAVAATLDRPHRIHSISEENR